MSVYAVTITLSYIFALFAQVTYQKKKQILTTQESGLQLNVIFVILTILVLVLVAGLRWRVGTDYWQYAYSYDKYVLEYWDSIKSFDEPGIKVIAKIGSLIYNDSASMFFIASLVTVGLICWTLAKYSSTFSFSILLFIFIGAWHGSFNGVRQYLACAILFAGHRLILERKFWKFALVVFVAGLFHQSAFIMILIYFIPQKQLNFKSLLLLTTITVIIIFSYSEIINLVSDIRYEGKDITQFAYTTRNVNILRVAINVVPIVLFLFIKGNEDSGQDYYYYINMLFVNAALSVATSTSAYLTRFTIYTFVFLTMSYPHLLSFQNKKLTLLLKMIVIMLYAIFWYYEVSNINNLRNYQWIFIR